MALLDRLGKQEQAFWTAGADFYRENLADEFLLVFPGVGFLGRDEMISAVENGRRWDRAEITDLHITELSDGAAVLSYSVLASRDDGDGEATFEGLVSSAYVREDGGWKLAVHQQTPTG